MDFAAGWLIDGTNYQYKIVKVIGKGGFGITYLAKRNDGLDVVVKTLNDTMQNKPEFNDLQAKFMKEAFFLKGCKHPHIVKILDICQSVNLWCMVMDAIDGETLWERGERKGALPESEALGYIQQIGSALEYMHNLDEPLLHRDLNPKNIMIRRRTKDAVLIDFGLAREFVQDKTARHTRMGCDGFAPIEQYDEYAKRGAFTDVYGLAAALYFALTAERPAPADSIDRKKAVLVPPRRIQPNINRQIEKAILHGMKLKAKDRPQSVQKWIDELITTEPQQPESSSKIIRLQLPPLSDAIATLFALFPLVCALGSWAMSMYSIGFTDVKAKSSVWWLALAVIVMMSLTPLVGDWLNGFEKQGKLKGLWRKLLVVLAIAVINAILAALAINAYDKTLSLQDLLIIGAVPGIAMGTLYPSRREVRRDRDWQIETGVLSGTGAGAGTGIWSGAWLLTVDLTRASHESFSSSLSVGWIVYSIFVLMWTGVWLATSQALLNSVGKWKATMILLGIGLAGLGVGLLVKVLFVR